MTMTIDALVQIALILRVVFLMVYTGVYLSYSLNRKDVLSLSPAHRAMLSGEAIPAIARLGLICFLISSLAGIPLFVVVFERIGHLTLPFILEGLITVGMLALSVYGIYLARSLTRPVVTTAISAVDSRFKWVSVRSEQDYDQKERTLGTLSLSSALMGVTIIGVGLVIG